MEAVAQRTVNRLGRDPWLLGIFTLIELTIGRGAHAK
jgi:hypothetical protein